MVHLPPLWRYASGYPFVPRPDLRGVQAAEWDEQVSDLHYADTPEYATGHGVSAEWEIVNGACRLLRSAWIPSAEVEKTATGEKKLLAPKRRTRAEVHQLVAELLAAACGATSFAAVGV